MDQEELAAESMRVLALLEQRDQEDEADRQSMARLLAHTIPPPPRLPPDLEEAFPLTRRTQPPKSPPQRMKDIRHKLAEAWVLLTEAREGVSDWKDRSHAPVRLRPLEARLQHAIGMVDDALGDLEPDQERPTLRP